MHYEFVQTRDCFCGSFTRLIDEVIAEKLEASNHKSAKTLYGAVCDSWPWSFDPEINRFPGLVEHMYVKFGDHVIYFVTRATLC